MLGGGAEFFGFPAPAGGDGLRLRFLLFCEGEGLWVVPRDARVVQVVDDVGGFGLLFTSLVFWLAAEDPGAAPFLLVRMADVRSTSTIRVDGGFER